MNMKEFIKHAIGGGLIVAFGEYFVNKYLSRHEITGELKHKYMGGWVGTIGGSVLGYYIGEKIANHDRKYTLGEKIASSAAGAASGGLAGIVLGHYLGKRVESEKED